MDIKGTRTRTSYPTHALGRFLGWGNSLQFWLGQGGSGAPCRGEVDQHLAQQLGSVMAPLQLHAVLPSRRARLERTMISALRRGFTAPGERSRVVCRVVSWFRSV